MRLVLACIGRARDAPEQELCEAYLERARNLGTRLGFTEIRLAIVDTSRASSGEIRAREEAEKLRRQLPTGRHLIALDETGRSLGSEHFAKLLTTVRDSGMRELAFVIGGPDGLARDLRSEAQDCLAFGPQTWPHLQVRVMLAEQIYRAFTILAGHPYHRGALR